MHTKEVKLVWDSQFCGREELTVQMPEHKDEEWIKSLFFELMGVQYNQDCYYEIVG